jgi:hypothetical protein
MNNEYENVGTDGSHHYNADQTYSSVAQMNKLQGSRKSFYIEWVRENMKTNLTDETEIAKQREEHERIKRACDIDDELEARIMTSMRVNTK